MIIERPADVTYTPGPGVPDGQIATYVSDPNAELVIPNDPANPAIAYKADGTGAIYNWKVATQTWV